MLWATDNLVSLNSREITIKFILEFILTLFPAPHFGHLCHTLEEISWTNLVRSLAVAASLSSDEQASLCQVCPRWRTRHNQLIFTPTLQVECYRFPPTKGKLLKVVQLGGARAGPRTWDLGFELRELSTVCYLGALPAEASSRLLFGYMGIWFQWVHGREMVKPWVGTHRPSRSPGRLVAKGPGPSCPKAQESASSVRLAIHSWSLLVEELMPSNSGGGKDSWESLGLQGDQISPS